MYNVYRLDERVNESLDLYFIILYIIFVYY